MAALRLGGIQAELVAPPRPGATLATPLSTLLLPSRLLALAGGALRARQFQADVYHLHYARHGWVAPLLGGPYVLHCHGTDVRDTLPGHGWGRVVAAAMRGAAAVLYSTPDLARWVAAYRADGQFLPNPIGVPAPIERPVEQTTDVLVGVRLDPIKGPDAIAQCLAEVVRLRPATTVTLIDHGSQVGRVQRALREVATTVSPVPHAAMPSLFARHRVAVGWMGLGVLGNFEFEAMAAGLPTAAHFGYPDAYTTAPPVIDAPEPVEQARALVELLDNEPARAAHGEASRAWVAEHHDPARIAQRLIGIYGSIIAASGSR